MVKKTKTAQEKKHLSHIAELGCIACAKLGWLDSPAEIHHIKNKTGIGRKASNFEAIPLCPEHHRNGSLSYHYSPKNFTITFGTQALLLDELNEWLSVVGCPCGCIEKTVDELPYPNPYDKYNNFYM
tara:strand:+ start:4420 stop:4800 length:381 start_codon:yes stop_codon:yes gene_type:complete